MKQISIRKVIGVITLGIIMISGALFMTANEDINSNNRALETVPGDTSDTHESVKYFRNENDWMGAYIAVQHEVRKRLDLPASAEFPWNTGVRVERLGKDQMYEVDSYVEIESASNKIERIPFWAKVHQDEDDRWVIFELSIRD